MNFQDKTQALTQSLARPLVDCSGFILLGFPPMGICSLSTSLQGTDIKV